MERIILLFTTAKNRFPINMGEIYRDGEIIGIASSYVSGRQEHKRVQE